MTYTREISDATSRRASTSSTSSTDTEPIPPRDLYDILSEACAISALPVVEQQPVQVPRTNKARRPITRLRSAISRATQTYTTLQRELVRAGEIAAQRSEESVDSEISHESESSVTSGTNNNDSTTNEYISQHDFPEISEPTSMPSSTAASSDAVSTVSGNATPASQRQRRFHRRHSSDGYPERSTSNHNLNQFASCPEIDDADDKKCRSSRGTHNAIAALHQENARGESDTGRRHRVRRASAA